jgi:hypothetical protein
MILAQGKTSPLMCMLLVFFQYDVIHKTRLIRIESKIGRKKKSEKSYKKKKIDVVSHTMKNNY